ncbi:MAG: hypothetical protein KIT84_04050 [Labilithrix sp.]|nr:hypothetical protein [Labilithrix sp.]MCW5810158.1 hypothetical protein [Labilithrix sp.]
MTNLSRRSALKIGGAAIAVIGAGFVLFYRPYPPDTTPEGAYMRVARHVGDDDPRAFFSYIEQEAIWACYTLRDVRKKARDLVLASYPAPQRDELAQAYAPFAEAPDGADVFAHLYRTRGWGRRLRKDLSGVAHVDRDGDRASVVTVKNTRWPFKRRDNGIWGIMIFTAELLADAEKASRDLAVVEAAAKDYEKLKQASP